MKVIRAIRLIALLALSLAVAIIAGNLTTRSFHWYYDLSDHAHMIWKVFFPTLLWGALLVSLSVEQPISGDELRVIKRYLATREDKLPWLFISERQTQLTRQAVNHIIRVAGETAKLGRIWPHMLRHSCGYYLADRGTDLRTMQDYLGHRDPKHTAHYTRVAGHRFEGLWR